MASHPHRNAHRSACPSPPQRQHNEYTHRNDIHNSPTHGSSPSFAMPSAASSTVDSPSSSSDSKTSLQDSCNTLHKRIATVALVLEHPLLATHRLGPATLAVTMRLFEVQVRDIQRKISELERDHLLEVAAAGMNGPLYHGGGVSDVQSRGGEGEKADVMQPKDDELGEGEIRETEAEIPGSDNHDHQALEALKFLEMKYPELQQGAAADFSLLRSAIEKLCDVNKKLKLATNKPVHGDLSISAMGKEQNDKPAPENRVDHTSELTALEIKQAAQLSFLRAKVEKLNVKLKLAANEPVQDMDAT
ncbi:hypothetical protein K504DRAFT_533991 [Pleomassaria siparia CBS 279.74]|uniref:Uncharacterized protein n=1 Tax=Pleomassaria siparia CBS 279.74 TaxID=1314801 RepID=A0A6G1KA17_9PLEO|nr:hypothetical protein K504DRAFT_533991 [Pleomassaria siparia CBS 279.74]